MSTPTKKALVAESDSFQSVRLARVLKVLGYKVDEVQDGLAAKELLDRSQDLDLLICDLSLPLVDGFALITHLRQKKGNKKAFVAAISGFPSLRATALKKKSELGIDDILSKTYDEITLAQILKRSNTVLEQRQASEAADAENVARREEERLALVAGMHLVDEGPQDETLKKLMDDTAKLFNVPTALITLVLEDKQWFKAHSGLGGQLLADRGSSRDLSFCSHVVDAEAPETLVVPDAKQHPVFKDNKFVLDGSVGGYVGAPLQAPSGQVLGTLCLVDTKPVELKAAELSLLKQLARRVAGELELQRQRKEAAQSGAVMEGKLSLLAAAISQMQVGVLLMDAKRHVLVSNRALAEMVGRPLSEIVGRPVMDFARANMALFDEPADYLEKMKLLPDGPYVADEIFYVQRPYKRLMRWMAKPILLADGSQGQLDLFIDLR